MDHQFDVIVILNYVTASPDPVVNPEDTKSAGFGKLIELDWFSYDLRGQRVVDEKQFFIKPNEAFLINPETKVRTGISNEDLDSGFSLKEVLDKFNDNCHYNYTKNNKSYCVTTFGDLLLTKILPLEIKDMNVKLPPHFYQFFDILTEFKKIYPQTESLKSVKDIQDYLQLRDLPSAGKIYTSQIEAKTLVRIINKMVRDSAKLISPKLLDQQFLIINNTVDNPTIKKAQYKKWSAYIRGKSPEPFKTRKSEFYIRMRNVPDDAREPEIFEFFNGFRIRLENICFLYSNEGFFTGEAHVRLLTDSDWKESFQLSMSEFNGRFVEVLDSTKEDWSRAHRSQFPESREEGKAREMVIERGGILKLVGLPLTFIEADISAMFSGFTLKPDGIKRSIISGKPSGEAFVLLDTEEDAQRALEVTQENWNGRTWDVRVASVTEYEQFMAHNFINSGPTGRERLPALPYEKRVLSLVATGFPCDYTLEEIKEFFKDYKIAENGLTLIQSYSNKFTGSVMITFEEQGDVERALRAKNLAWVKNCYVELFEYK